MNHRRIESLFVSLLANLRSIPDSPPGFRDVYEKQALRQAEEIHQLVRAAEGEEWQQAGRNVCIVCGGQGFAEQEGEIR